MEAKPTPGTWMVGLDSIGSPVIKAAKCTVATVSWCGFTMGDWQKGGAKAEVKRLEITANARLLAAAPELLEALEALLVFVDHDSEDGMLQCVETVMARDAITKARGLDL